MSIGGVRKPLPELIPTDRTVADERKQCDDRGCARETLPIQRGDEDMRIYRAENYEEMSFRAADVIAAHILLKPDAVLGLATGSTPVGTYRELVERYDRGKLSFGEVKSVNLDEYRGLSPEHEQSYRYFMEDQLFRHIDICPENTHVPNGIATDLTEECRRYSRLIRELGRAELQLLGMGHNGHIGFNEPGESFIPETHEVELTEETIRANQRFFASMEEVPTGALTMGIREILSARHILLLVSGEDKAETLCKAVLGPVTPYLPASVLQLHQNVTLIGDRAALSRLEKEGAGICG